MWLLHYDTARRQHVASCVVDGVELRVADVCLDVVLERVRSLRGRVVVVPIRPEMPMNWSFVRQRPCRNPAGWRMRVRDGMASASIRCSRMSGVGLVNSVGGCL